MKTIFGATLALTLLATSAGAADLAMVNKINDQAYNHSEVLDFAAYLTDRIGGRLTNSPSMRQAEAWTLQKFQSMGLSARKEGFEFGRGWWIEEASVKMVQPRPITLRSIPLAWTPATNGVVQAPIVVAPLRRERDFAAWRGKLAGKIVLISLPTPPADQTAAPLKRWTAAELSERSTYQTPEHDPDDYERSIARRDFMEKMDAFLAAEGAVAWARMSYRDGGLVHGNIGGYHKALNLKLPAVELAAEDYRRLTRLAKVGPVTLRINSKVHFETSDPMAYNIVADLPGRDARAGYVMAGAHLDSWAAADGAVDNAAGSAVVMEAARILKTLGVKPKRSIRFVLWSGEEQGLLGSAAYIDQHLARRPPHPDPKRQAMGPVVTHNQFPITPLPGFTDLAGYFNIDNGSGKIRGIYGEGNAAAAPILRGWLEPFSLQGATTTSASPSYGTDHVYFARLGLPAFQFVQDPLDYFAILHHTSADSFDHIKPDELRQAAAIMAWVLYNAADAETPLPANVLPTEPKRSDPFAYPDPDDLVN